MAHRIRFHNYFILKCYRFLTTAIIICSVHDLAIHKSFKVMFYDRTFWCYPGCDKCLLVLRILFWNNALVFLSEDPKVKVNIISQLF